MNATKPKPFFRVLVLAILLGAGAALAGCAASKLGLQDEEITALTPEQQVFYRTAQAKFALSIAVAYESQGRCSQVLILACSDKNVVELLRTADKKLEAALAVARASPENANIAFATAAYKEFTVLLQKHVLAALLKP